MTGLQMTLAILLIIFALALIVVIMMQKNREANASAVQGTSSSEMNDVNFFDKTGAHAKDDTLAKITKVIGILFTALALATTLVLLFVK
ncbi:MAG: preprotein translocase subunit SecG [Clostridia bacterium]|nr:preprotein translocase subunit SecG [Clostridia bacterium]